eukprot:2419140-Amphidinium_carterae.1
MQKPHETANGSAFLQWQGQPNAAFPNTIETADGSPSLSLKRLQPASDVLQSQWQLGCQASEHNDTKSANLLVSLALIGCAHAC